MGVSPATTLEKARNSLTINKNLSADKIKGFQSKRHHQVSQCEGDGKTTTVHLLKQENDMQMEF